MSKFPTTERCSLACFITLHAFLFFPSPSLDFEKFSREMARDVTAPKKRGIPVDKKIFSTRYQRRGILDVGWQRSHGALNIFSVCLSGAKISRSSRRVLLGFKKKKKKKFELSSLLSRPCFFLPHSSFFSTPSPFTRFPFAASTARRILTGILADSNLRSSYPDISHNVGGGLRASDY